MVQTRYRVEEAVTEPFYTGLAEKIGLRILGLSPEAGRVVQNHI
jgi:hypothetical protein